MGPQCVRCVLLLPLCQLSIESAVNYLPNQWDRGEESACLLTVTSREPITILVCPHKWMGDVRISSAKKAVRLRTSLHDEVGVQVASDTPLAEGLGKQGFILALVDCDDLEIIVPHTVVPRFEFSVVATFQQDQRCRYTTGECHVLVGEKKESIPRRVTQDTQALGEALTAAVGAVVGDCSAVRKLLVNPSEA